MFLKEQPVNREERKVTPFALEAVLLAYVVLESRVLGCVESSVILGAGEMFPVLLVVLRLVLLGGLEHLEALAAEEEAVTLDQVWTVVAHQVVVGEVKRRCEFEFAGKTALLSVRFQHVARHLARQQHLDSTNYQ